MKLIIINKEWENVRINKGNALKISILANKLIKKINRNRDEFFM